MKGVIILRNKGFTFLELTLILALIVIVAAIGGPSLIKMLDSGRSDADEALLYQLNDATESYVTVSGLSLDSNAADFVFNDCKVGGNLDNDLMIAKLIENGFMISEPKINSKNMEFQWSTAHRKWIMASTD